MHKVFYILSAIASDYFVDLRETVDQYYTTESVTWSTIPKVPHAHRYTPMSIGPGSLQDRLTHIYR